LFPDNCLWNIIVWPVDVWHPNTSTWLIML
jgi:hypothetical protein